MTSADLRSAPAGTGRAGGIAAQFQRAPAGGFFLEYLAGRFLGRPVALLAGLGRGTMQRTFGGRLTLRDRRRLGGCDRVRRSLGDCSRSGFGFGGHLGGGLLGVAFLLGLARGFALLLFLDLVRLPLLQRLALARFLFPRRDFLWRQLESG